MEARDVGGRSSLEGGVKIAAGCRVGGQVTASITEDEEGSNEDGEDIVQEGRGLVMEGKTGEESSIAMVVVRG